MKYGISVVGETALRLAELTATVAHGATDQKRKYTGDDYIIHPRAVLSDYDKRGEA